MYYIQEEHQDMFHQSTKHCRIAETQFWDYCVGILLGEPWLTISRLLVSVENSILSSWFRSEKGVKSLTKDWAEILNFFTDN